MGNVEFFCSVQEEVCLCAVNEARRDLLYAGLENLRVEYRAVRPGEASLAWSGVEWDSAVLILVGSVLSARLITAMGVTPGVVRHRANLERQERGMTRLRRGREAQF